MNILCTSSKDQPYVKAFDLVLSEFSKVTYNLDAFFDKVGDYDYVMINWSDEIFGWNKVPTNANFEFVESVLDHWNKASKIIVTMHNFQPHTTNIQRILFNDLIYKSANIVIHLGHNSVSLFNRKYRNSSVEHIVVPHVRMKYLDDISREEARESFGFRDEDVVVLLFGSIRKREEYQLVRNVFDQWGNPHKKLLVSNYKDFSIRPIRLIKKYLDCFDRRVIKNRGRVDDDDIQRYFKASDIVFIPRIDTLNSGIICVSAFFERVAIGANVGNIGESLNRFRYPLFDVKSISSTVNALEKAYSLSKNGVGRRARRILDETCDPIVIRKTIKEKLISQILCQ